MIFGIIKKLGPIFALCLIIYCASSQLRILESSVIEISAPADSIPFLFETNRVIITLDYLELRDSIIPYYYLDSIAKTDGKINILFMDGYWASDSFSFLENSLKIDLTDSATSRKYAIHHDIISINDNPIEDLQIIKSFRLGAYWGLDCVVAEFLLKENARVYNKATDSFVANILYDIRQYENPFGISSSFYFPDGVPFLTIFVGYE